jgi:uncharacterized protein (DUF2249 family)
MTTPQVVELDVRPMFERQMAPLPAILGVVNRLEPGQSLRLIAPFEPKPLYELLGQRGYSARKNARADGAWEILFEPAGGADVG